MKFWDSKNKKMTEHVSNHIIVGSNVISILEALEYQYPHIMEKDKINLILVPENEKESESKE